ncbi:MAG TPA: serine hydrolase domain-containing protein [Acidimicrobiales bacterium]|nr:serine hydrolase domain-containing protein [Acidimicrobiales bacterium]
MEPLRAVADWPVDHVAAAALTPAGVHTEGDVDRPFALASVTKLLTATAVLVAVEEEIVDLDEPAGPPGATVRHLLAHASGLGPDGDQVLAAPGATRIYSNRGYELLGELVADRAGLSFATYLDEAVLAPLGMAATALEGSPAHGARSTVGDLLRFAGAWLGADPVVIHHSTRDAAAEVAFPGLHGVLPGFGRQDPNDWGLGPELRGDKRPHWTGTRCSARTFGHFGRAGTFLWVDPDADVALLALTDREFGPWAASAWPALADAVLDTITRGDGQLPRPAADGDPVVWNREPRP